jgi:hypothetical protein
MTEAERYEKRAPPQKGRGNKPTPQQLWTNAIADASEAAPAHLKHYMRTMSQLDNVPRKEKQFRNFTANSLNLRGGQKDSVVSEIWALLQVQRQKQQDVISRSAATPGEPQQAHKSTTVASDNASAGSESRAAADGRRIDQQPTSCSTDRIDPTVSDASSPPSVSEESKGEKNASIRREDGGNVDAAASSADADGASSSRKKEVRKAIKSLLKKSKDRSLSLKALRRAVREQLKLPKKDVKRYVTGVLGDKRKKASSSSFELLQEGSKTTVRLRA